MPLESLIVVRHGESEQHVRDITGGWSDVDLTARGRQQAARVAERLASWDLGAGVALLSSDLRRAADTAEAIGSVLRLEVRLEPGLRELNNGRAAGLTGAQARALELPRTEPALDWIPYPGAESWRQMTRRVFATLDRLNTQPESTLILVTHRGAASAVVRWWLGIAEEPRVDFELAPTALTELAYSEWGERAIVRLNDTHHLT